MHFCIGLDVSRDFVCAFTRAFRAGVEVSKIVFFFKLSKYISTPFTINFILEKKQIFIINIKRGSGNPQASSRATATYS